MVDITVKLRCDHHMCNRLAFYPSIKDARLDSWLISRDLSRCLCPDCAQLYKSKNKGVKKCSG